MASSPLRRYVDMLQELVVRELRARHKQSLLGPLWVLVSPLLLLAPLALVFRTLIPREPTTSYTLFVYAGLLPWLFFAESVRTATESLVVNAPLIRRVAFARSLLPLAMVGTRAAEFLLVAVVTLPIFALQGTLRPQPALLALPPLFLLLGAFTTGVSLGTSVLFVYYRDVRHVVYVLLIAWMYATPILFAPEMLPHVARQVLAANPLAWFIDAGRAALLTGTIPSPVAWGILTAWSAGSLALGALVFRAYRAEIADVI